MSGTKSFDPPNAMDRVMRVFWSRGYQAVSIADLETATGLNRSSLYNAFGGKDEIFAAALARYSDMMLARILPALEASTLTEAVTEFLTRFDHALSGRTSPGGCLVFLAIFEGSATDGVAAEALKCHISGVRHAIASRFSAALNAGALAHKSDAVELTALTLAVMAGLASATRLKAPATERRALIAAVSHALAKRDLRSG